MILYLDTSALLKLYVKEAYSSIVGRATGDAASVCTHLIAYAETRAGLARARRSGRASRAQVTHQIRRFERDWKNLDVVMVDMTLVRRAGDLADRLALRAYDSVHLAAAEAVALTVSGTDYRVAVFDARLAEAAQELGLRLLEV